MAARLAGITMKLMPKTNTDQVANRLLAAGLARTLSPQAYLALKTGLAGLFITFGLLTVITGAMAPIFGLMIGADGRCHRVHRSRLRDQQPRPQPP